MHAHMHTSYIYTRTYTHTLKHTQAQLYTQTHTCKLCVQLVRTYTKSLDGYCKQ